MDLRLYFTSVPSSSVLTQIDRRLSSTSKSQEAFGSGRRLWVTHVPETSSRPFLHAKAYDIFVSALTFSSAELEDFNVGLGASPRRIMICRTQDDQKETIEAGFYLALEIMSDSEALLSIDESLGRWMFHVSEAYGEDFPIEKFGLYPGRVYEIAHERSDGDLKFEWCVDARWLRAWLQSMRGVAREVGSEVSRFASLDYT